MSSIRKEDFALLIKVFHETMKQCVTANTYEEREKIIKPWVEIMQAVDLALADILFDDNQETRQLTLEEFEKRLDIYNKKNKKHPRNFN